MGNLVVKSSYGVEIEQGARKREAHQYKIAELITQMKLIKLQADKEISSAHVQTLNSIIQQNSTIFENAPHLFQYLSNDKIPASIKEAANEAIIRALEGYQSTEQLLEFSKAEINRLNLRQDTEFFQLLDVATEQEFITNECIFFK